MYIEEAQKRSFIHVQIIYNFSGHGEKKYWHFDHEPFPVIYDHLLKAATREHIGCDTKREDQRCERSRYYMAANAPAWIGKQDWDIYGKPNTDQELRLPL